MRYWPVAVFLMVSACGGPSPEVDAKTDTVSAPNPSKAINPDAVLAPLVGGKWCLSHGGCATEKPFTLRDGSTNWPVTASGDDHAVVEAQSRGNALVGVSVILAAGGGRTAGSATRKSLQEFALSIVGDCDGLDAYIAKGYTVSRHGVMDAPPFRCGSWNVRTARIGIDFNLSIDLAN